MIYAGTAATYGRGKALVVATGMQTEFGKIAQLLQSVESGKTLLQQNLDKVGTTRRAPPLWWSPSSSALGLLRGQPFIEMLIFGIALAVAVVPEALPAVVTISLAIGVQKMVKRNALIRRLPAVETLGSTSVICSDKTGTLTKDEMTVRRIYTGGEMFNVTGAGYEPTGVFSHNGSSGQPTPELNALLTAAVLASDVKLVQEGDTWNIKGDPTEGALVVAAAKAGLQKSELDAKYPRLHEIPFTSETKRMTTLHRMNGKLKAFAKGAPEVILKDCSWLMTANGSVLLNDAMKEELLAVARDMASEALRVLAIASKPNTTLEEAQTGMTLLGLAGMIDPPRSEAKSAIALCEQAGIGR